MRRSFSPQELAAGIQSGDRLSLARACTEVENDTPTGEAVISLLFGNSGHAHLVGITGSPGTGKSSLVNQLVREYRTRKPDSRVAVIAVDPTSPFSGGAVLGDRVRMRDLSGDTGVFIRSMATRGALGGLSRQTTSLALLFDCAGYDMVFIETVGAGQSEVDIVRLAHTTIVVEAPGLGDDIQAIKAGILEIADILVINKADHPGADATERALRMMLELAKDRIKLAPGHHLMEGEALERVDEDGSQWAPDVLRTVAIENKGISELVDEVLKHRQWLQENGRWKHKEEQRIRSDIIQLVSARLFDRWVDQYSEKALEKVIQQVVQREYSPFEAVKVLLARE